MRDHRPHQHHDDGGGSPRRARVETRTATTLPQPSDWELLGREGIESLASGSDGHLLTASLAGLALVNEIGGWESGDDILGGVASRFRERLGPDDRLGRIAGARFLVLTPETDPKRVANLADRLVEAMAAPFEVLGQPVPLTATVGIASIDQDNDHADAVPRSAWALAHARSIHAPVAWYDDDLHRSLVERRRLANELRQALEDDRFVLMYQPTYELRTGRYVGAEALLRWEHPERGLVPPEQFVPTADRMGLGGAIGAWVLSNAIAQLATWDRDRRPEARGGAPPLLWVNLSLGHVATPGAAEDLLGQLRQAGIEPTRLGVELTQSAFSAARPHLADELRRLRDSGVRIAIDDFGTGSGSVAALRELPVDVLKVDTSFVNDITSRRGRETVRAILGLARAMDVEVVAEGVESPAQLAALRELDCDVAGGFLFARPVPSHELHEVVDEGRAQLRPASADTSRGLLRTLRGRRQRDDDPDPTASDLLAGEHDPVTGLGNRRAAMRALAQDLDAGRRPVLLLIELDSFSAVSLIRGPAATDSLLRAEARKLESVDGARAFRVGPGRFALCLPDSRRGHVSSQVDLVEVAKGPKGLTACIGVAHARPDSDPAEIEARAEQALVAAQRRGQGSVVDHLARPTAVPTANAAQARALAAVLRAGYLRVHYQPIYSLHDRSVIGYQGLARPQFDHGLAGPMEAFEVAEALGLVPELDAVCRSSVFADGPGFDLSAHTRLFVTIAPQALGHRSLRSGQLVREVRAAGLDPSRVVLQLRESPAVPSEVFDEEARWLKERGFAIALDDAGGRTSGLRALAAVPFDVIKLAPDLLGDLDGRDNSTAALVDALGAFCSKAGLEVIATGIESAEQLATAKRLRAGPDTMPWISAAQGYLLGKPRPQPRLDAG